MISSAMPSASAMRTGSSPKNRSSSAFARSGRRSSGGPRLDRRPGLRRRDRAARRRELVDGRRPPPDGDMAGRRVAGGRSQAAAASVAAGGVVGAVASSRYAPGRGRGPACRFLIPAATRLSRDRPAPFLIPLGAALSRIARRSLLDRDADERPVLRPRAVVVADVRHAEQLVQDEPRVRRALADAAVRDRVLAQVDALFAVELLAAPRRA